LLLFFELPWKIWESSTAVAAFFNYRGKFSPVPRQLLFLFVLPWKFYASSTAVTVFLTTVENLRLFHGNCQKW
jgi:hypothetical protein